MFARLAEASLSLDIGTLFVIAICVTSLLGLFLLFAWVQDRISALAWWGAAYLIGGDIRRDMASRRRHLAAAASKHSGFLLFIAVGMIWSAARLFHGRPVLWGSMCLGAVVWLASSSLPAFAEFGRFATGTQLGDRRYLHVPDRRRAVARAAQIGDPAMAGDFRADAAWRDFPVSGGAGGTIATQRTACSVSATVGSPSMRSKSCFTLSAQLSSCSSWRRTAPCGNTNWRPQPIR